MTTIFWDVDTQHDFMRPEGKLYVPGAETIAPTLRALTDHAHREGIRIVASADDHVAGHRELSATPDFLTTFPDHCMRGTPGQRKVAETALRDPLVIEPEVDPGVAARVRAHRGDILLHKHWFDVFTNENVPAVVDALAPDRIVLYGVATDVCDKYAIEGLRRRYPAIELWFVTDAARAIHPERTEELLAEWRAAGVRLTDSATVIQGGVAR
ncbi:MAG TPA: isochorismatase family protein [Gemmatimonadales bacterium]|nr:isochorismatase family protein [Gemmatimonadales bacterium]